MSYGLSSPTYLSLSIKGWKHFYKEHRFWDGGSSSLQFVILLFSTTPRQTFSRHRNCSPPPPSSRPHPRLLYPSALAPTSFPLRCPPPPPKASKDGMLLQTKVRRLSRTYQWWAAVVSAQPHSSACLMVSLLADAHLSLRNAHGHDGGNHPEPSQPFRCRRHEISSLLHYFYYLGPKPPPPQ